MSLTDDYVHTRAELDDFAEFIEPSKAQHPPRPSTKVDVDAIPQWLKDQPRWGLWKPVWRVNKSGKGRWEKVPVLSTNAPEKWLTFDQAWKQRKGQEDKFGLGFVLTGIEDATAFDLDHCLSKDGKPEAWAAGLIDQLDTYTEVTVGGDGIRMFVHGAYASDWVNKDDVSLEVYSGHGGRFVTATGNKFGDCPQEIARPPQEVLDAIEAQYRLTAKKSNGNTVIPEMPELLEDVPVPPLRGKVADFLASGECEGDRSKAVWAAAQALTEAGLTAQQVLSLLAENPYALEVGLGHRRQEEDRAHYFLWKHYAFRAAEKVGASQQEGMDDLTEEVRSEQERLEAEFAELAKLPDSVFATQAKDAAKRLRMPVADLRKGVARHKRKPAMTGPVDYQSPLPFIGDDGFPLNHVGNLKEVMRRLGVVCRYNVISKAEELLIPGESYSIDNGDNASFAWLESECSRFNLPTTKLNGFLTHLADKNLYNPVVTWVTSKPWDRVSRLDDLSATLTVAEENKKLRNILLRRWMISAIALAFSPNGCQTRGTLVLQGDQSLGKTRWFMHLTPAGLNLAKEGLTLDPRNKDSVTTAISHWLVELGELDSTFRKSDIAALKAFLTNMVDIVRRPYARKDSRYARRTAFFGSVNPEDFLHDPTGSTRFWVVPVTGVDYTHNIDMQQVWAEILTLWEGGEQHWLTKAEEALLAISNEQFEPLSPIQERVMLDLNWDLDTNLWRWISVTDLLSELGIVNPTRAQCMEAGNALRKCANPETKRRNKARLLRLPHRRGVDIRMAEDEDGDTSDTW